MPLRCRRQRREPRGLKEGESEAAGEMERGPAQSGQRESSVSSPAPRVQLKSGPGAHIRKLEMHNELSAGLSLTCSIGVFPQKQKHQRTVSLSVDCPTGSAFYFHCNYEKVSSKEKQMEKKKSVFSVL